MNNFKYLFIVSISLSTIYAMHETQEHDAEKQLKTLVEIINTRYADQKLWLKDIKVENMTPVQMNLLIKDLTDVIESRKNMYYDNCAGNVIEISDQTINSQTSFNRRDSNNHWCS
jgi:hypothetical protein